MNKLIILFLTITIGCNQSENNSETINQAESDTSMLNVTEKPTSIQENIESKEPEQFNSFFENYNTDSIFQISRTRFPLEQRYWEIGDDEPTYEIVNKSQWSFITFDYHDSIASRKIDAYTQMINYGIDTTKLEIRGVDNGIFIDYNFANNDGRWYLVSIHDYSN